MRAYFRERYHANKDLFNENLERYRLNKLKKFYAALKHRMKCVMCPEKDWACLDFHHINPDEKIGSVVVMARTASLHKALAEAEKCEVLCANCHRKHHHGEYYKELLEKINLTQQ